MARCSTHGSEEPSVRSDLLRTPRTPKRNEFTGWGNGPNQVASMVTSPWYHQAKRMLLSLHNPARTPRRALMD